MEAARLYALWSPSLQVLTLLTSIAVTSAGNLYEDLRGPKRMCWSLRQEAFRSQM